MVELYGIDVEDELEVSPFEYLDTFGLRSDLYKTKINWTKHSEIYYKSMINCYLNVVRNSIIT